MRRRTLLIALAAAALYAVVVTSASAELHRLSVKLTNGQSVELTVDVPPGSSVQDVALPALPAPVDSIVDLGPVSTPTPTPTATATPMQTPSPTVTATPTPGNIGSGDNSGSVGGGGSGSGSGNIGGGKPKPGKVVGGAEGNGEVLEGKLDDKDLDLDKRSRDDAEPSPEPQNPTVNTDGSPTLENPTVSLAEPGAARIGVPNFFIDKFRIPPFLLPIYQAAGIEYGVRWEVLAAINEVETDYGRNLNVSSAGALGWMQFMPPSWEAYGVDANKDGLKDPYNPADAIFAAARYLKAAGADKDLRGAIWAYNHADWYVDMVLLRARLIGGLPADLVGSLTGLTQGRFPVQAKAMYANEVKRTDLENDKGTPAYVVDSEAQRDGIRVFAKKGAPVVAVNDGRIVDAGRSRRLGNYVKLQDVYGNTYTYGHLGSVVQRYPVPRRRTVTDAEKRAELKLPPRDAAPAGPASTTTEEEAAERKERIAAKSRTKAAAKETADPTGLPAKQRLFAHPERPRAAAAGGEQQAIEQGEDFGAYLNRVFGLDRTDVDMKPLAEGARVTAGTVLGRIDRVERDTAPHVLFEIRPAGKGAPRIDPKPILDGWKLLESTAIYRAAGRNPFVGKDAATPSVGQILLMSKEALIQRVLADPSVSIYGCGRRDIRTGQIDRRVLATLEFLVANGLKPTVTSLRCGHSYLTSSGNVSEHSTGTAVDIAAVNGITITPETQGPGSITEVTIQRLLTLQGTMKPHQIISLMKFEGTDNTFAMGDHGDHIHVGFRPLYGSSDKRSGQVDAVLKPSQWIKLIDRLDEIENPEVAEAPSEYAIEDTKQASRAHKGE
jgi:hypothetical protein